MRAGFALCAVAASFLASAPAANETEQHLTLDQGRALAVHALKTGNPGLALRVSDGLLQANSKDPLALMLRAAAYARLDEPAKGRKSAVRAYRFAKAPAEKFQAAQLASRLSLAAGSPTMSQFWLRRTAVHASDPKSEERIAKDYQVLRRINPWSFRLSGGVKPSNNVNNGADSATQIIDGLPVYGDFGPHAVALSGIVGTVDLGISRRLRQSKTSQTTVSGRLYLQRVALSSSAKKFAADLVEAAIIEDCYDDENGDRICQEIRPFEMPRNSDFGSTFGELSLRHSFAVGPPGSKGSASLALTRSTAWYGGRKTYDSNKLSASRSWQLSTGSRITFDGSFEDRFNARSASYRGTVLGFGSNFTHKLKNGNTLNLTFGLRETKTGSVNTTSSAASFRVGYELGKSLGPATVNTGLILGYSDYPAYSTQLGVIPGGRQDQSIYADVNLFFEDYDYAGFAPMLRVRAGKKFSNHSRFETKELSVSLGIESKF